MAKVRDLPLTASIADADFLYVIDTSLGVNGGRKITFASFKVELGTLQAVYQNSVAGRLITNATQRALKVEEGPSVGGNLYEAYNSSGVLVFSVDATGNITLSGTVDGRDVAADGLDIDSNTAHRAIGTGNPHAVTKAEVGLSDVSNDVQIPLAQKGVVNGVASLDMTGRIPTSQLPTSTMEYKGAWDATANTPSLTDGIGTNGDTYRVSVGGTRDLGSGSVVYNIGDSIIYNGSIWELIAADDAVQSVNGLVGAVVLGTDDVSEEVTNHYANTPAGQADIDANTNVAANSAHRIIVNGNPHNVTKAEVGLSNVENIQVNLTAIIPPTTSDDTTLGYTIGSKWIDTVGLECFVLLDATTGAAVWQSTTSLPVTPFLHVRDEKPQATEGGAAVVGVDQTRDLNTVITNTITGASLASNQITLPAGLYQIEATAPGVGVSEHRVILYSVVGAATLLRGPNEFTTAGGTSTNARVRGRFTLGISAPLELRHRFTGTSGADALGESANFPGENEVYSEVLIWRIG